MEDIMITLQETISHQGDDIRRLSEELYTQQKEIAFMHEQIARLEARLKHLLPNESNIRPIDQETPPPHY